MHVVNRSTCFHNLPPAAFLQFGRPGGANSASAQTAACRNATQNLAVIFDFSSSHSYKKLLCDFTNIQPTYLIVSSRCTIPRPLYLLVHAILLLKTSCDTAYSCYFEQAPPTVQQQQTIAPFRSSGFTIGTNIRVLAQILPFGNLVISLQLYKPSQLDCSEPVCCKILEATK